LKRKKESGALSYGREVWPLISLYFKKKEERRKKRTGLEKKLLM